jgi:glycosyltransferase involved in cell wall biosynthesis
MTDGFFSYSNYCRDYLEDMGVSRERIVVIGNNTLDAEKYGRDVRETRQKKQMEFSSPFVMLVVSQLIERKNVVTILKAYLALSTKCPKIELRIAGEGPEKEALKSFCDINNLANVTFLGNITEKEILKEYERADVLIHTALMDQWPQVVNEAFSCGVPAIVSETSGIDDNFVVHGENAFIIKPTDHKAIEMYLEQLIQTPLLKLKMGQNAYKTASEHDLKKAVALITKTIQSKI